MLKKFGLKYFFIFTVIFSGFIILHGHSAQAIFSNEELDVATEELGAYLGWGGSADGAWGYTGLVHKDTEEYHWETGDEHKFQWDETLYISQGIGLSTSYAAWNSDEADPNIINDRLQGWVDSDGEFGEYHRNGLGNPSIVNISGYRVYKRTYGVTSTLKCPPPSYGAYHRTGTKMIAYIPQPDDLEGFIKKRNGLRLLEIVVRVDIDDDDKYDINVCQDISRSEQKAKEIMAETLSFFQPYVNKYLSGQCNNDGECELINGENCQTCPDDCYCRRYQEGSNEYTYLATLDMKCDAEAAPAKLEKLVAEVGDNEWDPLYGSMYRIKQAYAEGCVLAESDCGNGICDDGEDYTSCCKDCPCPENQSCINNECAAAEVKISLDYDKKSAIANGKDDIQLSGYLTSGDKPLAGEDIAISFYALDKKWEKLVGLGSTNTTRVQTNSNGGFSFTYQPDVIIADDSKLSEIKESDQIWLMMEVEHTKSGEKNGRKIYTQPYKPKVSVEKIVPIQALKGMPLVAGKKMAVMVAVKSEEEGLFEENKNLELSMDFWIDGDEFKPQSKFEKISLTEPSQDDSVIRIAPDENGHFEEQEFLGIERTFSKEEWEFYNFYVDPVDTHKQGIYFFKTQLFATYKDSLTGEDKTVPFDFSGYVDDVYPSGFMSVKVLPLAVGLWNEDFCNFCTISKGPMEQLANFGKRLIGRKVANDADWQFTCNASMFEYTWDGIYDDDTIESILNTTTVGRLLSGDEIPPRRDACRWGFINTFLKTRPSLGSSLLDHLRSRGLLAFGSDVTETQEEKYKKLARASTEYLKAIMPLAEENLIIQTEQKPYHLPGLDPNIVLPSYVLFKFRDIEAGRVYSNSGLAHVFTALGRNEYETSGGPEFHGFTRIAAFVPTGQGSNLAFEEEGYESPAFNPSVVLVNNNTAEEDVLAHEISHTYCAIDEDSQARQSAYTPALCGEGGFTINFNWNFDTLGDVVKNGFWVEKREYRGQPSKAQYSFMGAAGRDTGGGAKRWVTDDLYYGLGVKLGVFPSEKEDYYSSRE